jgi:hypothetical protein
MTDEDMMRRVITIWFLFGFLFGLWLGLVAGHVVS